MKNIQKKNPSIGICRRILNSVADGVFTVDNNLEITFFNRSAGKITGIHEKNAIGEKCYDVFKTDICSTKCALKRSIETGEDTVTQRVNMKNSKGMLVPISVSTSVLLDYDGT